MKTFRYSSLIVLCLSALLLNVTAEDLPRLIIDSQGPAGAIKELLFTPDGSTLISLGDDKAIRFWDVESGELRQTLRGEIGDGLDGQLFAGALSPDGRWLAVGGRLSQNQIDGSSIRLIDLSSGELAAILRGHLDTVQSLDFSHDGRWLASGSTDADVRVWDLGKFGNVERANKKAVEVFESKVIRGHTSGIYSIGFSADGRRLISGSLDGTLILWKRESASISSQWAKATTLKKHTDEVLSAAYSPSGQFIVSGGRDHQLLLWDGRSGEFLRTLDSNMGFQIWSISFSTDGKRVLASSQGSGEGMIAIYDLATGKKQTIFSRHNNLVFASAWHPTANLVATAGGNDHDIYLWHPNANELTHVTAGSVKHHFIGQGRAAWVTAFSKSSELLIAFGQELNPSKGKGYGGPLQQSFDFTRFELGEYVESRDGNRFRYNIFNHGGRNLQFRDNFTLQVGLEGAIKTDPKMHDVMHLSSFTPDGTGVVIGAAYSLKLYRKGEGKTFREVQSYVGHMSDIWAVSPSPDGRYIASASSDQTTRLWNLKTGDLLASLFVARNGEWVCWLPSGHYHASPGGERYIGWHINHGIGKLGEFFPSYVFHKQFHNPDLVKRTIMLGDFDRAMVELKVRPVSDLADEMPPRVAWVSPTAARGKNVISNAEITVQAKISSPHGALEKIKLLLNGKSIAADHRPSGDTMDFEQTISLLPGENRISIYASNHHSGYTSDERVIFYKPAGMADVSPENIPKELMPNLYLLSVGISEYENVDINLEYCDDDARAIAVMYQAQKGRLFGKVEARVLTDADATREAVLDGLGWLESSATQQDIVILFLAAHGANDTRGNYYLLPAGGDFAKLRSTGVAWDDFSDVLGNLPSKTLMFLDTCHSGQLGANLMTFASRGDKDAIDDASEAIRELTSDENGVVIMAASTGREDSVEHEDWGHGAFTMALIEGIGKGKADLIKDGVIHLRELDTFVSERVKELTKGIQHPTTVKPSTISRFPVARTK